MVFTIKQVDNMQTVLLSLCGNALSPDFIKYILDLCQYARKGIQLDRNYRDTINVT